MNLSLNVLVRAALTTLRISIPTVIDGQRGTIDPRVCDDRLFRWSAALLQQIDLEFDVEGSEHIQPGQSYVVMSNHQSLYDIPALYQSLKCRIRMVAKKELFYVPVWAQAMRAAGFVELDRRDRARAIQSLGRAEQALRSGTNIWIAPEGTRSKTGALGSFKKGGFYLALNTGTPILPVSIDGTHQVLPAKGWRVHNGATVRVTVSEPVDPTAFGHDRRDDLVAAVRDAIGRHLRREASSRP